MPPIETDPFYKVSPNAVFEAFEDEVIVINMTTGSYFALDEVALGIWTLVQAGHSLPFIIEATQARYEGDAETIASAVKTLLSELAAEGLLVRTDEAPPATTEPVIPAANDVARTAFTKPTLSKFTDMEDLLLLDPIHEVDEMGWPHAKAAPSAEA